MCPCQWIVFFLNPLYILVNVNSESFFTKKLECVTSGEDDVISSSPGKGEGQARTFSSKLRASEDATQGENDSAIIFPG